MLSDLLPSIVLILPPCLCAGETSTIDIHIEHPVSIDARYDIVCMMRGLHITSTPVQPSDGLIIRSVHTHSQVAYDQCAGCVFLVHVIIL